MVAVTDAGEEDVLGRGVCLNIWFLVGFCRVWIVEHKFFGVFFVGFG